MEKKTSPFGQIPIWLSGELSGSETNLFLVMYNGWRMMKKISDNNTYYRSFKKLKEDLGIKSKNNNKIIDAIKHFEELGILRVERNGKKTNRYEFNEFVLFNHNDVPETGIRDVPETGTSRTPNDVPETGTIYKNKENIKQKIKGPIVKVHVPEDNNLSNDNNMEPNENVKGTSDNIGLSDCLIDENLNELDDIERDREQEEQEKQEYLQWLKDSKKKPINGSNNGVSQAKLNNDYVSGVFQWLDAELDYYKTIKDGYIANSHAEKITNYISDVIKNRNKFSMKQWDVVCKKLERWTKLAECKNKYFNEKAPKKPKVNESTSKLNDSNNHNSSDVCLKDNGGCAEPRYTEDDYNKAINEVFKGWTLFKFLRQCGYGYDDERKQIANILGVDFKEINERELHKKLEGIFIPSSTVEEPEIPYGKSSIKSQKGAHTDDEKSQKGVNTKKSLIIN